MQFIVALSLLALASAYQPYYGYDDMFERRDWLNQRPYSIGYNLRTPFWNQRDRFLGLTTGFHDRDLTTGLTGFDYRTNFLLRDPDLDMVKSKLVQGAAVDRVDFEIVRHKIHYVSEIDLDEIEHIVKTKINRGVPVQRFEAAILKECVKTKVARGIPIDKLESEVLKEVVKAKLMRGIPIDKLEAKVCVNNIKNKLVKGRPVDPLDFEILIDYVKSKIVRNREPTNLECELVLDVLKHKIGFHSISLVDPIEGEVLVECIKNKARRGSPVSRREEDMLLSVVNNKQFSTGFPVDRKELEIAHEISKNKIKRGEDFGLHGVGFGLDTMMPWKTTFPIRRHNVMDTLGLRTFDRGLYGNHLWNRCPTTGFYDLLHDNLFTTGRMFRRHPLTTQIHFNRFDTIPFSTTWNY